MTPEKLDAMRIIFPFVGGIAALAIGGWVLTTWMRIRNGYPLDVPRGQSAVYPRRDEETTERVRLLSTENAQLRAELGSIKDRLATVERIVTDEGPRIAREIEMLRGPAN